MCFWRRMGGWMGMDHRSAGRPHCLTLPSPLSLPPSPPPHTQPIGAAAEIDDDHLLEELANLESEQLDAELLAPAAPAPSSKVPAEAALPAAPAGKAKAKAPAAKAAAGKTAEELELEALEKEMAA